MELNRPPQPLLARRVGARPRRVLGFLRLPVETLWLRVDFLELTKRERLDCRIIEIKTWFFCNNKKRTSSRGLSSLPARTMPSSSDSNSSSSCSSSVPLPLKLPVILLARLECEGGRKGDILNSEGSWLGENTEDGEKLPMSTHHPICRAAENVKIEFELSRKGEGRGGGIGLSGSQEEGRRRQIPKETEKVSPGADFRGKIPGRGDGRNANTRPRTAGSSPLVRRGHLSISGKSIGGEGNPPGAGSRHRYQRVVRSI